MKRYPIELSQRSRIRMVADDQRDFALQFTGLVPVQQVQAVHVPGYENGDACAAGGILETPLHLVTVGDELELAREVRGVQGEVRQIKFSPHEKQPCLVILVLIRAQNVRTVRVKKSRNRGHNALGIQAIHQQDRRSAHRPFAFVIGSFARKSHMLPEDPHDPAGLVWP
jgi:hypothetical protein